VPGTGSDGILAVARWVTATFVAVSAAAAVRPGPFGAPAAVVDGLLFAAGCGLFLAAYGRGVRRSRRDLIGIGGLYFLAGDVAPPAVRRTLLGALAVQVVTGIAAAAAQPYTIVATGVLAPVFGLGLCGYWASRHGRFDPREPPDGGG